MSFFITGLPRSRTAWLANFLTYDGVLCGHELMFGMTTATFVDELKHWSGSAETLLLARWREIDDQLKDAPIIIIRRAPKDVMASLRQLKLPIADLGIALTWMQSLLEDFAAQHPNALNFSFSELNNNSTLQMIWQYVSGKEPQPERRVKMLQAMNVQITADRWMEFFYRPQPTQNTHQLPVVS